MSTSPIEWTDATWNPVVGCRRVSAGCERWIRSIVAQCKAASVPVFATSEQVIRNATAGTPLRLRDRKGVDMGEWPEDLRVREFPGGAF